MKLNKKTGVAMFIVCAAMLAIYTFVAPAQAASVQPRYVGSYIGSYLGEADFGSFELTITEDGKISGMGKSSKYDSSSEYSGVCQNDGTLQFTAGDGYHNFAGHIDWMNRIFGKWTQSNNALGGSFTAVPSSWSN